MPLTDEEMAKVDAEWEALPGTPPDGFSFIPWAELGDKPRAVAAARMDAWRADGMTHGRLTEVQYPEAGVWVEVWKVRPYKEAPFNPPYTAESQANPTISTQEGTRCAC